MSNPGPQQVTLEQAYDEACRALGEALTQQCLIAKTAAAQIKSLKQECESLSSAARGEAQSCIWCSQLIADEASHYMWHKQNDLHAAACEYLQNTESATSQKAKKAHACTCGVHGWNPTAKA